VSGISEHHSVSSLAGRDGRRGATAGAEAGGVPLREGGREGREDE